MKGLILAIQFLTRLPAPRVKATAQDFAAAIRWFPAAGLAVGGIVAGAAWAGHWLDAWSGALAGLIAWMAVTGALHLDGLGDMADASGAAHKREDDPAHILAILADPHLGSFGVCAIGLQIAAKLILLHGVIEHGLWGGLVAVPLAARIGPLVWARWIAPLHQGLGARFAGAVRRRDLALWTALLFAAAGALRSPALLVALPAFALWRRWIVRKIGGISGDGHGAGIELVETLLLAALLVAHQVGAQA